MQSYNIYCTLYLNDVLYTEGFISVAVVRCAGCETDLSQESQLVNFDFYGT